MTVKMHASPPKQNNNNNDTKIKQINFLISFFIRLRNDFFFGKISTKGEVFFLFK